MTIEDQLAYLSTPQLLANPGRTESQRVRGSTIEKKDKTKPSGTESEPWTPIIPRSTGKEIIATGGETHGVEEFVVMGFVSLREEETPFVLVVEAKNANLGEDMRESNNGGAVYGFITAGDRWKMARYDGVFRMSEGMEILFDSMDEDKGRWMKDYSIVVDCLLVALNSGSVTEK
ncbi:unnamed protein product [Tuber aestivum]|uniref:Uncharacterized protein n=1 Tax=Tuber aestivum TaxID=59557 RepID=A0A292Q9P7_9PEZI|nr:unnamed protein product [Tuber aestivum]